MSPCPTDRASGSSSTRNSVTPIRAPLMRCIHRWSLIKTWSIKFGSISKAQVASRS